MLKNFGNNVSAIDRWIKKMWHIYTIEYYSATKRNQILPFADNMVSPKRYYFKWNKVYRERQMQNYFIYMWNLKMKQMKNRTKQRQIHIHREQVEIRGEGKLK